MCRIKLMCLVWICSVAFFDTEAQQHEVDSLRIEIEKTQDDSAKVNSLLKLIRIYENKGYPDLMLNVALDATALARKINYQEGVAESLLELSAIYFDLSMYDEMWRANRESVQLFRSLGDNEGVIKCLKPIVQYQIRLAHFDSAYMLNSRMYTFYDSIKNDLEKANALLTLAKIRSFQVDDKSTLRALLRALKIFKEINDENGEGWTYQQLGNFYHGQENWNTAKYYFKIQLENTRKRNDKLGYLTSLTGLGNTYNSQKFYDSALLCFDEALREELKINDLYGLGVDYNNKGEALYGLKRYPEAYQNFQSSVAICKKIDDVEGLIYPIQGMSLICIKRNQLARADSLLKESLHLAMSLSQPRLVAKNYEYMSFLDSARGNFKGAFLWYKKGAELEDSLLNEKKSREILAIQADFEVEQKEDEISLLNQQRRLEAEQQDKIHFIYIVIVGLAGVLILALLYILRSRILFSRLAVETKNEILQKNEALTEMNSELKSLMAQLENRQRELEGKNVLLEELNQEKDGLVSVVAHDLRSPIAKTLGLLQVLDLSGELNTEQREIVAMMKKVSTEGNNLINDLLEINSISIDDGSHPEIIDWNKFIEGFIPAHKIIAERKNITLCVETSGSDTKLITYVDYLRRVLDNLVSNAIKFSHPDKTVIIRYTAVDGSSVISVTDAGQGIRKEDMPHLFKKFKKLSTKPTAGESSSGLGLSIVKALVEKMDGTIEVQSEFGKGSSFTITIKNKMTVAA